MATTESRSGFRLPWSSNTDENGTPTASPDSGWQTDGSDARAESATDAPATDAVETGETSTSPSTDGFAATEDGVAVTGQADVPSEPTQEATEPMAPADTETATARNAAPSRKQNKFLADLTKAMQAAAETARESSLGQFQAEAKSFVEGIHSRSATEAADLRKRADDDIAEIREWSKAEIARIREETEGRISGRKARLETEIEEHAARIEHEIERLQSRVTSFEAEMDGFFERLRGEEDPTRFAAMAENLPEAPAFEAVLAGADIDQWVTEGVVEVATQPEAVAETDVLAEPEVVAEDAQETDADPGTDKEWASDPANDFATETVTEIQTAPASEAVAETETAPEAEVTLETEQTDVDPRLAAFGFTTDFAAAEAEAAAAADATGEGEEIPVISDDALAARLAGLVPAHTDDENGATTTAQTTSVVVVGLVSVASIASFKRHLGRLAGVHSVGVSSGPDGEFLFTVSHGDDVVLRDAIPNLPGFGARVVESDAGSIRVTARDPESES
jgi:hypothetical protein